MILRSIVIACVLLAVPRVVRAQVPAFDRIFIIVMENREYGDIVGNPDAPYINSLAREHGLATNHFGVTHPSLPNYMALTGGETVFTENCLTCRTTAVNIADRIEASGRSWTAYMESMPAPCGTSDSGLYAARHNPFIYYTSIVDDAARCTGHVVPFSQFGGDLAGGGLAQFVWITPNLCSDMHDCPVSTGDAWLSALVPQILQSPAFANSLLILTWDEGTTAAGGGGHVPLIVASARTPAGFETAAAINHYNVLRTIEDAWGLAPLGQSASATALTQFFPVPGTPPAIATQPQSQTIAPGQTATLSVATSGTAPIFYQWYVGPSGNTANPIAGATGSSYTTPALASATSFWVRASNAFGAANSATATITVCGFQLAPSSSLLDARASDANIVTIVASPASCAWTASDDPSKSWLTITAGVGVSGTGNGTVAYRVRSNDGPERRAFPTIAGLTFPVTQQAGCAPATCTTRAPGDFDGDAQTDIAVFRPSFGSWRILTSSSSYGSPTVVSWGLASDKPVPGDYDGDGKIDPAVYRASTGGWHVLKSSTNYSTSLSTSWGLGTDVPAPADYDGDRKTDPAVYRPSTGGWYILKSTTSYTSSVGMSWGLSTDVPLQGDYDGDGKADPAVFRASTGGWYVLKSANSYTTSFGVFWGLSTDVPVPGDYDGDGRIDPAVYRPSSGGWYILKSSTGYATSEGVVWGLSSDVAVPGDYDGDGAIDPAIFRPSTGLWAMLKSSTHYSSSIVASWGVSTDVALLRRP